jgi:hypothetical protein
MAAQTYIIKQFGIVSVAKFFAVLGVIWGLIVGICVAAGIGRIGYIMGAMGLGFAGGLFALILMIIIGGIFGFIGGAIVAIVYNVVLGATGGVEMDLEVKG